MKKKKECKQKIPAWMATFSDMVTLLLVFFVMLLATGDTKIIKTFIILSAFEGKLGALSGGQSLDQGEFEYMGQTIESLPSSKKMESLNKSIKNTINNLVKPQQNNRNIRVDENEKGVTISLMTDILFDHGEATLKINENRELIENLRVIIDSLDSNSKILFEGHADDHPIINPQFKNQWDLSVQRALAVLSTIESIPSIKPLDNSKISVRGFGNTKPIENNKTPEASLFNRRVDIVITVQDN